MNGKKNVDRKHTRPALPYDIKIKDESKKRGKLRSQGTTKERGGLREKREVRERERERERESDRDAGRDDEREMRGREREGPWPTVTREAWCRSSRLVSVGRDLVQNGWSSLHS